MTTLVDGGCYRLYDATGSLLYVGVSAMPDRRIKQHQARDTGGWGATATDWRIDYYANPIDALLDERAATLTEHPAHPTNVTPAAQASSAAAYLIAWARWNRHDLSRAEARKHLEAAGFFGETDGPRVPARRVLSPLPPALIAS